MEACYIVHTDHLIINDIVINFMTDLSWQVGLYILFISFFNCIALVRVIIGYVALHIIAIIMLFEI